MEFGVALAVYVVAVLAVGALATRRSSQSAREYFLAGGSLGTVVLFMALFGTNTTPFVLIGIPGIAYHQGVGIFGVNAPIVALGIPLTFWAIGSPARRMGARLGAMTPAELFSRRFESRALGLILFAFFSLYTLPYMVTAVVGAAKTLEVVTEGAIPSIAGGVGVLLVALVYTSFGGMRATAWTNVLQGTLFLGFMVAVFFLVPRAMGGLEAASARVRETEPKLLELGSGGIFEPRAFASWGLAISLTVIAFPHMLVRLMAADSERSLKNICRGYPIALALLWVPAVMLGVWGAALVPGLVGKESDKIFAEVITQTMPPWLSAIGFLAVIAAVMSTLDAQILTLGSMVTRDVLKTAEGNEKRDVAITRASGVVIALLVFAWWQLGGASIFDIAAIAFSGYVTLAPTLFFGVRWRRFTTAGAVSSILVGNGVYALALLATDWNARAPSWLGFLPVFWALLGAIAAGLVVSLATTPQSASSLTRAFGANATAAPGG